jgi:SagB-type dehydrogenase family enzyme
MRLFNSAWEYHEKTKYSFDDVKSIYQEYVIDKKINSVKTYQNKKFIKFPDDFPSQPQNLLESYQISATFNQFFKMNGEKMPLEKLEQLLYLTNGVSQIKEYADKKIYFRTSPSAGALYPIEIYLIVNNVENLEKGLYYFNPIENGLYQLEKKDFTGQINKVTFHQKVFEKIPVILLFTYIYQRNFWKYKERAFRYALLDNGYILENLSLAAASLDLKANIIGDFIDIDLNMLLKLNSDDEVTIVMAGVGSSSDVLGEDKYEFGMLLPEDDYIGRKHQNLIKGIYQNSCHYRAGDGLTNVNVKLPFSQKPPQLQPQFELIDLPKERKNIEKTTQEVIGHRRSCHNFLRIAIAAEELSTLLYYLKSTPVLYNFPAYQTYLVVSEVENLPNGIYRYHPQKHQLEYLKRGTFRGDISYLTQAQDAVFNCSVSFFFSVNFEVINLFSNRGYRYAHLNVGMVSENIYLIASALGLGARGISNYFDDNINQFFKVQEPHEHILGGVILGVPG